MLSFLEIVFLVFTITFVRAQRQGDLCVVAGTIQPGVCRHIMSCSVVLEAAFHGLPYQVCASPENRLIVCCPWVPGQETRLQARCQANTTAPKEGDNCKMVDTGKAGVCSRFANCQTAIKAASKGQSPQICAVEGTDQIICCPLVTVAEGDQCSVTDTGRAGKCLRISKCPVAVEAALRGITPQICAIDGTVPVVCCEGVIEGSNCTLADTGMAGVCEPFAYCQTAKEAASKGILPQVCGHDSPKIKWVPSSNGHVPSGALRGGHTETGETMYIARAYHEKANTPGKLAPSHGCCYISFAGAEIRKTHYEVLVIEDNLC